MTPALEDSHTLLPKPNAAPRRCLLLANPKAGALAAMEATTTLQNHPLLQYRKAQDKRAEPPLPACLSVLASAAARVGLEANVEVVPPPSQIPALLQDAQRAGYDTLIVAGGDGTINRVAQFVIGTPLRLGILPMGTANNFARALGIPADLEAALRVIAEGMERNVEVGRIGEEFFLEGAGVGLFADFLAVYGANEPRLHQIFHLMRALGPLCWNPLVRSLEITLDGVVQRKQAVMVTVANCPYLGENMPIAPNARLNDGLFDVVIVGALTRGELFRFAIELLRGRHLELPKVHRAQAKVVDIRRVHRAHHPIPVHADDHIAAYTPARLENVPGALCVFAPASQAISSIPCGE